MSLADSQNGKFAPCICGHGINSPTDPVQLLTFPEKGSCVFNIHNYCNNYPAVLCSLWLFYLWVNKFCCLRYCKLSFGEKHGPDEPCASGICLKICWQTGCPLSQSQLLQAFSIHPSGPLLCCHAIVSWQLLPSPSCPQLFEPKWDHRVYSVANLQVNLLNLLLSRASSVGFEWIFLFIVIQMVEILLHYADRTLKKCPDQGKIQVMEQHFQVWCSRGLSCIRNWIWNF